MNNSVFATLSTIDCAGRIEKKNNLSYLSWAWAWQILKEKYPSATYTIYENKDGLNYHTDGHTCWVKTGVTVEGIEHIEYLPIMDFRNASIPVGKVTSFDVNKAIQRSLTKAVARHGLGLYIYAGEDIPDPYDDELRAMVNAETQPAQKPLSAPKSDKPMMHQGHENWTKLLQSILDGKATLEQYKKKYFFPEADEIAAKEWLLTHQK
jgi:hypothetical protein